MISHTSQSSATTGFLSSPGRFFAEKFHAIMPSKNARCHGCCRSCRCCCAFHIIDGDGQRRKRKALGRDWLRARDEAMHLNTSLFLRTCACAMCVSVSAVASIDPTYQRQAVITQMSRINTEFSQGYKDPGCFANFWIAVPGWHRK
jgi:hypothetical protein